MNTRYLAVRGCEPIQVTFKTNLTQSMIDCYIQQYGLDFISITETYEQALNDIEIDKMFFDSITPDRIETELFLERCLQLEYNGGNN